MLPATAVVNRPEFDAADALTPGRGAVGQPPEDALQLSETAGLARASARAALARPGSVRALPARGRVRED